MFTEGLVDRLADEMYAVALTMKPEEEHDRYLRKSDLLLVLLHQYRCQKQDFFLTDEYFKNRPDSPTMYDYGECEALELAFDKLIEDKRLRHANYDCFYVASIERQRRLARATWPFPFAAPSPSSPAPEAPLEAAPLPPA